MEIIDDLSKVNLNNDTILTVGAFDGVHRGHQHLIQQMVEEARQTKRLAGLITFHPHPSAVLSPYNPTRYLSTPGEKAALLERLGLDILAILPFDQEMAQTSAQDFIAQVRRHLHLAELWVGEDFAADVRSLLPKFREVTDVKESEVIEPLIRTDDKVFLSVTKWFPKASIVSEAAEKQDSFFRIVDSRIRSMETKLSEMKRDFRERGAELRAEAQQKIESERENMRERLKRAEQEAFSKDFPQPLSSLETHARIISDKLNSIRSAAYSKDMDKIFETIQEASKALREAEKSIAEIEREYLKYQKEMEKFYKQREREIAAAEAEFQKREKKIQRELQEKIDKMREEIDQLEELIVRANQLREEINSLFGTWKENMVKEIEYARGLTIPLHRFGGRKEAFPIYLPFFVIKYQRNRKAQYHIVPPLIPKPESKVLYESPATLEELAVKYERNLKKGKLLTKIELGLRENNVLESAEKTQKLQIGISLLESSLHVDPSLVETVREAYEKRFEKSLGEG